MKPSIRKRKPKTFIKLQVPAQEANPSPPVGPALGQHGLNIMGFCKEFNVLTKDVEKGLLVPVVVSVFEDKSFGLKIKSPPSAVLIKKTLGLAKGSKIPNQEKVGKITHDQLERIAKIKMDDLNTNDLQSAISMLSGTAASMGVEIE